MRNYSAGHVWPFGQNLSPTIVHGLYHYEFVGFLHKFEKSKGENVRLLDQTEENFAFTRAVFRTLPPNHRLTPVFFRAQTLPFHTSGGNVQN